MLSPQWYALLITYIEINPTQQRQSYAPNPLPPLNPTDQPY